MILSRKGDYALRAVYYLANRPPNKPVQLEEISEAERIPEKFLSKILQILVKSSVVKSVRGCGGGYWLSKSPGKITFQEVIEAVEGPITLNRCNSKKRKCDRVEKCGMHHIWERSQNALIHVLSTSTMADLSQ